MAAFAVAVRAHPRDPIGSRAVRETAARMFEHYFYKKLPRAERFAKTGTSGEREGMVLRPRTAP